MKYYVAMAVFFLHIAVLGIQHDNIALVFSGMVPAACAVLKISRLEIEEQQRRKKYDK